MVNSAESDLNFDGGITEPVVDAVLPEAQAIPEKFQNADGTLNQDAMLKSYSELESTQSNPGIGETGAGDPLDTELTSKEAPGERTPEEGEAFFTGFVEEFERDGSISAKSYQEIYKETGLSQKFVDDYFNGQQMIAEANANEVRSAVGGKEEYDRMITWAQGHLNPEALQGFNNNLGSAMQSQDLNQVIQVVKGMHAQYNQAVGNSEYNFMDATAAAPSVSAGTQPFNSAQEAREFQKTAAYRSGDPKTHREFDQRLAISRGVV